jgi:hypothetical protein
LEAVEDLRRDFPVLGEEADLFGELRGFVEGVETFAPGGLLRAIDLAEVEGGALGGVPGAQPAVCGDAPVAMHLAVFLASVGAQKHMVGREDSTAAEHAGRG